MTDSIIMERVADAAAERFYAELVRTEDLGAFEALVAADARSIAAGVLRRCIERFDAGLADSAPRSRRAGRPRRRASSASRRARPSPSSPRRLRPMRAHARDVGKGLGAAAQGAAAGEVRDDILISKELGSCHY